MILRSTRFAVLIVALGTFTHASASSAKVDLGPTKWPPGDLEHYTRLQNSFGRSQPPATGQTGLVVGTLQALAVRAGVEALRQGGTAADAAVTTALTQVTLTAGSAVSFAGQLELVYYEASTGTVHYLNGTWGIPQELPSGTAIPACGVPSGRQVLVPGFMASLEALHARFGALPFKKLFAPAVYFARQGFEINEGLGGSIRHFQDTITRLPGGRRIFLKSDGTPYQTGDWFTQPRLARTLKRVSRQGSRFMYRGKWAQKLVRTVRAEGGDLTEADLRAYEALWIQPESFDFGRFRVHGPGSPAVGGLHLRAAMEGLNPGELRTAGHYTVSADALAAMLRGVERRYRISRAAGGHSDGVVAIDADGNVVALLHSINTYGWGATGIFVDGVSISDAGCRNPQQIAIAGPGGRVAPHDNPVVVTQEGLPVAATSAVGNGLFEATFFGLTNLLAYRMSPNQAIDTPTFHRASTYVGVTHQTTRGDFAADLLEAVRARGISIRELAPGHDSYGWWIGATIDRRSGERVGATANTFNGLALAQ
ncbi:MAG: hypothetical protein GY769_23985 [bacterium]|nr:hypothetical protein [bacterium]